MRQKTPHDYWIGLTDKITEGKWVWESGRPLSPDLADRWAYSQPDNAGGLEHCVEMRSLNIEFNDMPCVAGGGGNLNFVCQKRNTNTDLMEITSDGVTFETMDTKLPSKKDMFSYINLFKNPLFSSHAWSLSSCHRR